MDAIVKRSLLKTNPELQSGNHLPRWGIVSRIPSPISEGQLSTAGEPAYAVDVQLLTEAGEPDGNPVESVPLPATFSGNGRGLFGFPAVGTRVMVQYVYGSPAHPAITGIYPHERNLPALLETETLVQHSPATFLRSTETEDWVLQARNKLWLGSMAVNLVAEVARLAALVRDHDHIKTVGKPKNAGAIGDVANAVESIKK